MKILLVDDDPLIHLALKSALGGKFQIRSTMTLEEGLHALEHEEIDAALIDIHLSASTSGVDFLEAFKRRYPGKPAIIQSGERDVETIVRCMKLGADDFIEKPYEVSSLEVRLNRAIAMIRKQEVLERAVERSHHENEIVGNSPEILRAKRLVESAETMRILFHGETGVGKSPFARYSNRVVAKIHGQPRPFEQLNCAGLTREYFQDQIFGHKKGAFTGAVNDKRGLVEIAKGGDLFLDEIGEMPLDIQALFLTFLDTGEYYRLGDDQKRKADVRILCATNRDLSAMVRERTFRQDLYSRISQVVVEIPPLRARGSDIKTLFHHFVRHFSGYDKPYEPAVLQYIEGHCWLEGNVRELRDAVEYLCVMGRQSTTLTTTHIGERVRPCTNPSDATPDLSLISLAEGSIDRAMGTAERQILMHYYKECDGSVDEMAKRLGMTRPTLYRRLRLHEILETVPVSFQA